MNPMEKVFSCITFHNFHISGQTRDFLANLGTSDKIQNLTLDNNFSCFSVFRMSLFMEHFPSISPCFILFILHVWLPIWSSQWKLILSHHLETITAWENILFLRTSNFSLNLQFYVLPSTVFPAIFLKVVLLFTLRC